MLCATQDCTIHCSSLNVQILGLSRVLIFFLFFLLSNPSNTTFFVSFYFSYVQRSTMIGSYKTNFEKSELIPHTRISSQSQIENIYEVGEKIGQGSFGKVFSVTEKSTGIKWAMKCIHKIEKVR